MELNTTSLDTLCAALCYAMGIDAPMQSASANKDFCDYADNAFGGKKADRIFMYNPDAIGQWIYEKYPELFDSAERFSELKLPMCTVMPSVTPVCFGTMYTGAQPSVHGIQKYEKPVITIDTIFDVLIRSGKKGVIVAYGNSSLSKIYLERDMDYYYFDTLDEVNAKAAELILKDEHDFYVVYNGNYDSKMHKTGPESVTALSEIRANCRTYAMFCEMIKEHWQNHNTIAGFAMDHGCHEIDGECGSHGLDMPEDLNIVHLYTSFPVKE
ncbi:MAG: hypothetical protein II998_08215 [Clostridia bacterium]|nr:hypothetical protein [Clostridia bacterium]